MEITIPFNFSTWMASLSPELRTQSGVRPVVRVSQVGQSTW